MKPIKVNESSWHYWVATRLGDAQRDNLNICTYTTNFLRGIFVLLIAFLLMLFICVPTIFAVGQFIIPSLFHNQHLIDLGYMWIGLSFGCTAIYFLVEGIQYLTGTGKYRKYFLTEKTNIVVQAYQSWKGKFCVPIIVTKKDE